MKTIFNTIAILFFIAVSSCSQERKLFNATIIDQDDKKSLSYAPEMDFRIANDSAFYYFNQEDYVKIFSGDIKIGDIIYKNQNFKVIVIAREFKQADKTEHELILRTYGEDFRIIDSFLLSSTVEGNLCDGYLTNDLNVIRNCNDDNMLAGSINEFGKFLIP